VNRLITLLIGLTSTCSIATAAGKDFPAAAPPDPVFRPFKEAVEQYIKLRKAAAKNAPKLPDKATPEQIAAHKADLAAAIRAARSDARQGDVFTASTRSRFIAIIRSEVKGKAGASAKEAIMAENPEKPGEGNKVKVAVNAPYPPGAPVTTIPPTLLLRLPKLPEELEYRFVGRDLILKDAIGDLVIDYLPGVLP
jgi:hypothetical protein